MTAQLNFNEDQLEEIILEELQGLGYEYAFGPDIARDGPNPERMDYKEVILPNRVRDALQRLNPKIPEEALEELGGYVINTHIKDGCPPRKKGCLGPETPLGEGCVDYYSLIPSLYKKGFRGPLTIEREISGDKQVKDIKKAVYILEKIKSSLGAG